ncbi:MAG: outer membrane beta-barrel protein [Proteobacteria bacterium]|nr:outer membrane beta-barrel protein [Pseudomonadota bacterium]
MKKIIATTVAAAALISGSAFAAGAQTGLVLGGSVGYTMPTGYVKDIETGTGVDNKNGNIAGSLLVGYDYALSPLFSVGIELDGQYAYQLSKSSLAGDSAKSSNVSVPLFLTGKFFIPEAMGLNVFGKAGYAYNRLSAKAEVSGVSETFNTNLWRPVVAGGIGFQLQQFNIFAEYQYNWLPYQGTNGGYGTASLGLTYTLPM